MSSSNSSPGAVPNNSILDWPLSDKIKVVLNYEDHDSGRFITAKVVNLMDGRSQDFGVPVTMDRLEDVIEYLTDKVLVPYDMIQTPDGRNYWFLYSDLKAVGN